MSTPAEIGSLERGNVEEDVQSKTKNRPHSDFMSAARFRAHAKVVLQRYKFLLTDREYRVIWLQLGLDRQAQCDKQEQNSEQTTEESTRRTTAEVLMVLQDDADDERADSLLSSSKGNGRKRFKAETSSRNLTVRMIGETLKVGLSKIPILTRIIMDNMTNMPKGDMLVHEINQPVPFPCQIIFDNDDMVVINKQSGKRVTPFHRLAEPTSCLNQVCSYIIHNGVHSDRTHSHTNPDLSPTSRKSIEEVSPLHRLDVHTSGVLIFAKNRRTFAKISDTNFWAEKVKKFYYAILKLKRDSVVGIEAMGNLTGNHNEENCTDMDDAGTKEKDNADTNHDEGPHIKDAGLYTPLECELPIDGKVARTRIRIISWRRHYALAQCELIKTGRNHQIRRHCANLGMPLLGDREYMKESGMQNSQVVEKTVRAVENRADAEHEDGIFFLHCHRMILSVGELERNPSPDTDAALSGNEAGLLELDAPLPDRFKAKLEELGLDSNLLVQEEKIVTPSTEGSLRESH